MTQLPNPLPSPECPADYVFATEGVLAADRQLPKFSLLERKMEIPHQDWMNSVAARLAVYYSSEPDEARRSFLDFSQRQDPEMSAHSLSLLAGNIARISGIVTYGPNRSSVFKAASSLTDRGVEKVLEAWRQHSSSNDSLAKKYKRRYHPNRECVLLGRHILDNNLQVYDPETDQLIEPSAIIGRYS